MPSDQQNSKWYRPDPVAAAPEDLLMLMELAGVKITVSSTNNVRIYFGKQEYVVPRDEDGKWERNAYEIWQWVSKKGMY